MRFYPVGTTQTCIFLPFDTAASPPARRRVAVGAPTRADRARPRRAQCDATSAHASCFRCSKPSCLMLLSTPRPELELRNVLYPMRTLSRVWRSLATVAGRSTRSSPDSPDRDSSGSVASLLLPPLVLHLFCVYSSTHHGSLAERACTSPLRYHIAPCSLHDSMHMHMHMIT